jgi:ABC transport system ATP-binding/permease protein
VASHDRYLVERVTDTAYGMFGDGKLVHLPGGIEEYLARATLPAAAFQSVPKAASSTMSAGDLRTARKDLAKLERQLAKLEDREVKLNNCLAEHGSDYGKIVELETRLKAVQQERGQVEEAWLELAERVPES